MKKYTVYCHINKFNGKRYYGITCQDVNERWRKGNGYIGNDYFTKAINKYGWDNFEHIIIAKGLSKEEACCLEIELIKEWNSTDRDKGYNIASGGECPTHSDETKKKISEAHKGKQLSEEHKKKLSETRKGKHHTEESKRKISENHAFKGKKRPEHSEKMSGKNNYWYGKTLPDETRKKLSENHADFSGKKHPKAKLYKVIFLDGTEKIMCKNEICNSCSKGFLDINLKTFEIYILPYGEVNPNNYNPKAKNQFTNKIIEVFEKFNGIKIIPIEDN